MTITKDRRAFLKSAALTIRSSTKYLGGHGSAICGVVNVGWTRDTAFVAEDAERASQPPPTAGIP